MTVPGHLQDCDLLAYWCEEEQDFVYEFPSGCSADGGLLHSVVGCRPDVGSVDIGRRTTLAAELSARGYDPKTLFVGVRKSR